MATKENMTGLEFELDGYPGNLTDQYPSFNTELYVVIGILSVLSAMGTAGNALVLYVFSQKKDKLVSTLFIIVLALVDFITCLIVIPYTMYMEYVDFHIKYDVLCKVYQFLITSNIPFSALIMVAIAIDRYFCICHPFLHAINIQRAKIMIAALALFACGLGVVVGLMFGVYHPAAVPLAYTDNSTDNGSGHNGTGFDVVEPDDSREMINAGYNINALGNGSAVENASYRQMKNVVMYTGQCAPNDLILSPIFQWYYQKFFTAMYLVCLIIVIVLYVLIYKSVLARRTKRAKQKSKSLPLVTSLSTAAHPDSTTEETLLTTVNGANGDATKDCKNGSTKSAKSKDKSQKRKSTKRDKNRMANLKTAAMLFVVTVVFIVTFTPAFLMVLQLITYNMIVFYVYFANNVANPIIYSFMNKNFRDDLKRLFCSGR